MPSFIINRCKMSSAPITHIIEIDVGVDLSNVLFELAQHRGRSISVLNGRGMVEQVTLRQATGRIITHQGRFNIISIFGTIIPSSTLESAGELEVNLSTPAFEVIRGIVISPLVASSPVILTVLSSSITGV
ncbi:unnamed protein product [Vicia faba]|uniref:PPC domain-containing protein n=1 Tax=Vicia faba TaxID=3906 RepID=A0AAV0YFI5_VICFA|nr:unnamed protein product [Vicia faba]